MEWFSRVLSWLTVHSAAIAILVALVPIIWGVIQYIQIKVAERKKARFENYHKLIKWLVQGEEGEEAPMADRQAAVAYELRNFPEYYVVSIKILPGLEDTWREKFKDNLGLVSLREEISDSAEFMERKRRSLYYRMRYSYLL